MDSNIQAIITAATAAQAVIDTANGQVSTLSAQHTTDQGTISDLTNKVSDLSTQALTANTAANVAQNLLNAANAKIVDLTAKLAGVPSTRISLASLTEHNASNSPNYNKANYPALFTGTSHNGTTSFSVDPNLMDDSQNPAAPMNISKKSVRTLMPANWTGRIMNFRQAWWGAKNHPDIGFSDTDPVALARMADDSKARGVDVEVLDWYGINMTGSGDDEIMDAMVQQCVRVGQTFALSIDDQYLKTTGMTTDKYQAAMISAVTHLNQRYMQHPNYERSNGKPILILWNVNALTKSFVDWNAVKAAVGGNLLLLHYQSSGFTVPGSDGAMFWLDTNADVSGGISSGITYLTKYALPAIAANQSKIAISTVIPGFNGTLTKSTNWSDGKFIDRRNGQTWLDWWKANSDFVASGKKLDYVCLVTWDDFQEGSTIQGGILNDISFTSAAVTNKQLTWKVTGNENTVSSYDIYFTTDGLTVTLITSVAPTAAKTVDVSSLPIGATAYIQAVGQPCIANHLSAGVPILG